MKITLFDVLGIDPSAPDRAGLAKALWPIDVVSFTKGLEISLSSSDESLAIVNMLQTGLIFQNLRPGVDPHASLGSSAGQIGFTADVAVGALATAQPFYLRALPDHGIQLIETDPLFPARVWFVADGRGHEVVIERLPVKLLLDEDLVQALPPGAGTVGTFDKTKVDSYAYKLSTGIDATEVDCFVRLHLTIEGDLIVETAVPISFGPVRWMSLPATAVYDVQLLPSPNRRDYLEWAHNDVGSFFDNPIAKGALSFRSIDVDFSKPPFDGLRDRVRNGAIHIDNLELVLEDVAMPATVPGLPIPSHGTFGFRRKITDRTDIAQAYSLTGAPVQIPIYGSMRQGGNGGSSLTLEIEKFLFRTGDVHALDPADQPQVQLQAGLIWQRTNGDKLGATVGIDDEWTIAAGMVMDLNTTPLKFTIADTTVGLVGFKFGVSVGRLTKGIEFKDSFELLGDLFVTGKATGSDSSVFKMRSLTGKQLSVAIHDLGYKLGHFSVDGLQFPDGMQLIFANTVRIIIEEMGWVEEANGTPYFSFSGGVALGFGGGNAVNPSGNAGDNQGNGFGVRVRRLRFRLNDDGSQPVFKIDGVFLKLKYGTVDIEGFGYISDFTADGWAVKEWGFGVKVEFSVVAMKFSIAAMFIKGSRRQLDGSEDFDYFLAALQLGYMPAGPVALYDIRALVAYNFAPNLDAEFPDGEGMALLKWHQTHDNALTMPANRALADWIPEKDSLAFGVGCGFSLNGCGSACHVDIFVFFSKSKADTGLLIVGDLFLLKNPKPIAFVAIEYDIDKEKFGVMVGVNIGLADFASGSAPAWLNNIARLSGTLYFGNKPWSFAIGQLADQSTWLALKLDWHVWLEVKFMIGLCVQIVDGGPKGFGIVFTLSAGANWGIGGFVLWGTLGLIFGTWKTGSDSTGLEFWVELGFKINLFWIFSFGAEIQLRITYLGKHPWYITLHAEIRIDTPWFLPDVTFTIDKTWQEPMPFDTATITQSLSSASAIDATAQAGTKLLVPGLVGALGDASFVYTFNQLNGLTGARIADPHVRDDIPVVSVDSTIAIDLAQPSSNDSAIAGSTYDGTTDSGVQVVQDITVRYGLQSIAVRRAPRFGPTAGAWTDFVTDAETGFSIGGSAPEALTFAWDADTRADGKLAPKRLLVNSASPYSFATAGAQNDEEAARRDPDFPCCDEHTQRTTIPKPHVLEFSAIPFGARTPRSERFTNHGALWTWATPAAPVVSPGDPAYPGLHVARLAPRASLLVGAADLADPAVTATLELAWQSYPGVLHFEGYDGLSLIVERSADLHTTGSTTLSLSAGGTTGQKISRLVIRIDIDNKVDPTHLAAGPALVAAAVSQLPNTGIAIYRITYISLADAIRWVASKQRCGNNSGLGPPGSDAKGKLAFLPNHDYEVVVTETIAVGTKDQGTRTLTLSEAFYFRTKGLPGLNACPNVGDDIRRHVDATYPRRRAIPLYRQEPCVLAFENSLSSVLPIDRTPAAGDPPEKAQMFPLELNVDRTVSLGGLQRLTVPSNDWIAAHRANPYPPIYYVASPAFARSKVRVARSHDPLVLRFEAVKAAVPACGAPKLDHASQVLLHEPIDVSGAPGPWEPATGYRATVRQKDGPFTERSGFDVYDLGAFVRQADGGAAAVLWSVDADQNLVAPAAGAGRHYAACGELGWDHLQVHARIDLRTADAAGIAVGVAAGTPVPQAVLATVEVSGGGHALVVRARDAAGERELGRAQVTITGPFLLGVVAYDDVVRASVGEVSVDGVRGALREGRVALVSHGPAAFAGISVGALDIYAFDFVTSKFASFGEHMASYDGSLPVLAAGALGGTPAPIASVLAAHASDLPAVMQASADPQQRQRTFDAVVTALGIGLRSNPLTVGISQLTGATGSFGFLIESPEPISFTRDVALTLTRHVRVWVPGPIPLPLPVPIPLPLPAPGPIPPRPGPGPLPLRPVPVTAPVRAVPAIPRPPAAVAAHGPMDAAVAAGLASLASAGGGAVDANKLSQALEAITFGTGKLSLPREHAVFGDGDRIARVVAAADGPHLELYDAPRAGAGRTAEAVLRERLTLAQAQRDPALAAIAKLGAGGIGVVHPGGLGPILFGHWVESDVAVPFVALSNGSETAILVLSTGGAPLPAGKYKLHFVLDRDRWSASVAADPEQHYHDEHTIDLQW